MGTPTRFPYGVTNVTKQETMGAFIMPDPTTAHVYFTDFDTYTAADWTVTTVATASAALTDGDGGLLAVSTQDSATAAIYFDKVGASFLMEAGKKAWFKSRFKVSDATNTDLVMGLQITDTSPLAVSDGVFFIKAAGAATGDLIVEKASVATTASSAITLVSDTYTSVGFYYNGSDGISYFQDDVQIGTVDTTNLPDTQVLTVSFGMKNGSAAAYTLTMDYILAAKER